MVLQNSKVPVVIGKVEVKLKSGTYTYSANGFMKGGHCFDPDVKKLLPPRKPLRTKKGTIKVHQPYIQKKPLTYWRAQCGFRKMEQSGTLATLQERLRKGRGVGMDTELVKVEKDLEEEFWRKNGVARAKIWDRSETDEQKAEADADRFLREKFPSHVQKKNTKSGDGDNVIVLKTHNRVELHKAASLLGLCHQSVDAPLDADLSQPKVNRWIVIGRNQSVVNEHIQKVARESVRMRQRAQDAREEGTRKLHKTIVSNVKKTSGRDDVWDVAGAWTINCPFIESNWGRGILGPRSTECSLDIQFTKTSGRGRGRQMWAKFDFIVLKGVFRFEKPSTAISSRKSKSKPTSSSSLTHDDGDDSSESSEDYDEYESEDDDESTEDDDEFRRSPTPEEFYLGANEKPSPSCPRWNFRWRGEEIGEGEIQVYSDQKLCSVTFGGIGGTELTGWFISDLTEKIKFTGLKTGPGRISSSKETINDEWSSLNEGAYESARVGRWR